MTRTYDQPWTQPPTDNCRNPLPDKGISCRAVVQALLPYRETCSRTTVDLRISEVSRDSGT